MTRLLKSIFRYLLASVVVVFLIVPFGLTVLLFWLWLWLRDPAHPDKRD